VLLGKKVTEASYQCFGHFCVSNKPVILWINPTGVLKIRCITGFFIRYVSFFGAPAQGVRARRGLLGVYNLAGFGAAAVAAEEIVGDVAVARQRECCRYSVTFRPIMGTPLSFLISHSKLRHSPFITVSLKESEGRPIIGYLTKSNFSTGAMPLNSQKV
jgi:hypothetical protein